MKKQWTTTDINKINDPDLRGSFAAMQRAALRAREIAIATNTAIIVSRNGKVVRVTADELRAEDAAAKNQQPAV